MYTRPCAIRWNSLTLRVIKNKTTFSSLDYQHRQQVTQSKSLLTDDTDELSAQHLHQSIDLTDNEKQRRNNLSDSTELSSSVESLNDDHHKSHQVCKLLPIFVLFNRLNSSRSHNYE